MRLPGRESRFSERAFTRIEPLVAELGGVLAPELDLPYALFGHSMGALVGFELSRRLESAGGAAPRLLAVAGCRAPQRFHVGRQPLHELSDGALRERLRAFGGTPAELLGEPELLEMMLQTARADFELLDRYAGNAEPRLGCPVAAYGGADDPEAAPEEVKAWSAVTRSAFKSSVFPGGHFFPLEAGPFLETLARDLRAAFGE